MICNGLTLARGFRQLMTSEEGGGGEPAGCQKWLEVPDVEAAAEAKVALQVVRPACRGALTGCSTEVLSLPESWTTSPFLLTGAQSHGQAARQLTMAVERVDAPISRRCDARNRSVQP